MVTPKHHSRSGPPPKSDQVLFAGEWVSRNGLRAATERAATVLATGAANGGLVAMMHPHRAERRAVAEALRAAPYEERIAWAELAIAKAISRRGAGTIGQDPTEVDAMRTIDVGLNEVLSEAATQLARSSATHRRGHTSTPPGHCSFAQVDPGAGHIVFPTFKVLQGVREAIGQGVITAEPGQYPAGPLPYGDGSLEVRPLGQLSVYVPPAEVERVRTQLNDVAAELGDEDVDILDILTARWVAEARKHGSDTVVRIALDELLRERGLEPKLGGSGTRGGYRPAERQRVWGVVCRLRHLFVEATEIVRDGRKSTEFVVRSYVVAVTDEVDVDADGVPRAFVYRPGEMLAALLLGPMRQYTVLSQRVLSYHTRNQAVEKRLARLFAYRWRVNAKNGCDVTVSVEQLVEKAGENDRFGRRPGRARQRIEKALDRLSHDGVIGTWDYTSSKVRAAETKGWPAEWIQASVLVTPPDDVRDQLRRIRRPRRSANGASTPS